VKSGPKKCFFFFERQKMFLLFVSLSFACAPHVSIIVGKAKFYKIFQHRPRKHADGTLFYSLREKNYSLCPKISVFSSI